MLRGMLLTLLVVSLVLLVSPAQASLFNDPSLSYCKCICFTNSTIIPLYRPENPKKPCLSCTRQFCIDQKLAICKGAEVPELNKDIGTGTEGDVEARCFKRDSPRDRLVATFFFLIVMGLLLYSAIRSRLRKAVATRGRPQDLREWGEALLPIPIQQYSASVWPRRREEEGGSWSGGEMRSPGGYTPVSVGN
ncbi:hypothetical protein J007_01630 [Cryptococcus neoformans]|nr:hypothetical protein J007_01630 [Cryptococcus neoformans var. grubii]OXC63060.1 hypothetical protein C358_01635 [Cryptococcus neoformans var. grubii MW-RSA852]